MDVQALVAQYDGELAALLNVYQRRFVVKCSGTPDALAGLRARIFAAEWTWKQGFASTVAVLSGIDPVKDSIIYDIVMDRLGQQNGVLVKLQSDIAGTLGFTDPDAPISDIDALVRIVAQFSPALTETCDYLLTVLSVLAKCYAAFSDALRRDRVTHDPAAPAPITPLFAGNGGMLNDQWSLPSPLWAGSTLV